MVRYLIGLVIVISISGCAVTWAGVGLAVATGVSVAEDMAGIATAYKEFKENNSTKE